MPVYLRGMTSLVSETKIFIATCSKPPIGSPWKRVVVTAARAADGWDVHVERFTRTQCFTDPVDAHGNDAEKVLELELSHGWGQVHIQTPESDSVILQRLKSGNRTSTILRKPPSRKEWEHFEIGHRTKVTLLTTDADAHLLQVLDLASADGAILAAMADKFRQVNHLCAQWMPQLRTLAASLKGRPMSIVDAGCGKAYMSLALVYLLRREGIAAKLHGIDTNPHVIEHCRNAASELGMDNTTFTCGTIGSLAEPVSCDVVIALHACDTATDDALALALRMQAAVMIIAPCCHHYVQQQLRSPSVPDEARALLDDGITRERLGDLLTDTVRRDVLRSFGYDAHLEEFIALEHTQKNVLLRAVRVNMPERDQHRWADRVRHTCKAWGIQPRICELVSLPTGSTT